jgi:hypothetical protein
MTRTLNRQRGVAVLTAVALISPPFIDAFRAQTPQAAQPTTAAKPTPATPAAAATKSAPAAAASPAAKAATIDGGWPKVGSTPDGGAILMYQPQVASWPNQKHMVMYAAVSYNAKGAQKPALGTIKAETDTRVALDQRLVHLDSIKVTESNFPTLSKDQMRPVVEAIDKAIPDDERVIALDRILANVDKSQIIPKNVEGVKADPPPIFFSKTPAVLVNFDSDPIWSPIKDNDLKFAVNTNWDIFRHEPTNTFYLRNGNTFLKASDVKGPWAPAGTLPGSFSKLPPDDNWKDVRANLPGKSLSSNQVPKVFVSTTPAEFILLRGEPSYVQVGQTKLLWVNNTDSDVFRLGKTGTVYFLVAGRWFSAPDFTGPWTFATTSLPEDFKKIPLEHERSRVLASVPGTDQAAEAVMLASMPQTARVNKKEVKAPDVVYQGQPQFQAIEQTSVQRAVNTDKDILRVGDVYYMCFQGVWFMSKSASGPWEVATSIPKEIYSIPTSSPAHNVTYVVVEEDNDNDDWVTFAYAAGYTGMMVAWGCAVWGTGWYYPPYTWYGGYYPGYYPYFPTYGYSAWYNPWSGTYGRGVAAYGPYGGVGAGARYNPRTGTYARGAVAWGPYGASGAAQAWNPRTGTYAQTRQGSNVYGSWGSTGVQRGDDWAQTGRVTNRATGTTTRATVGSEGGAAVSRRGPQGGTTVGRTGSGDVYAGHDGNVYRNDGGSWQKYDNGNWNTATAPQQVDRDRGARTEGTKRTSDYGNYRSSGGTRSSAGSYRGGGGRRGGGGGRRR